MSVGLNIEPDQIAIVSEAYARSTIEGLVAFLGVRPELTEAEIHDALNEIAEDLNNHLGTDLGVSPYLTGSELHDALNEIAEDLNDQLGTDLTLCKSIEQVDSVVQYHTLPDDFIYDKG